MTARFPAGTVLGDRFEVHGEVGAGGTATVLLVTDRLRNERVALKVVHAHLAADPSARKRLQREVATAGLLHSPAALVPYDLHAFDDLLALSMPFHPGETLAERVTSSGRLPPEDVRALGIRIAGALADAHRAGLLHRDVTANNVLVGDTSQNAVLTDFGLSRLLGQSRSTGMLGTAGYAAPEIYRGNRSDARSDLYGLGAVLYLALTGRPAFDPHEPARALKQQLDGDLADVRTLVPDCPPDLADTVARLLQPDPDGRPQGAREVVEALTHRDPVVARIAPSTSTTMVLPTGAFAVVVRERSEDKSRRRRLRRQARNAAPTTEDEVLRWGAHLAERVRGVLGVPAATGLSPEALLTTAVADAAGVPAARLRPGPGLLEEKFVLVDGVDAVTARTLAQAANDAGFTARAVEVVEGPRRLGFLALVQAIAIAGIVYAAMGNTRLLPVFIATLVLSTLISSRTLDRTRMRRSDLDKRQVLFRPGTVRRGGSTAQAAVPEEQAPNTHPLADRAERALSALAAAVTAAELPEIARRDLRDTTASLSERARGLSAALVAVDAELDAAAKSSAPSASLSSRLTRLQALAAAGEAVDQAEVVRLERALAAEDQAQAAADQLASRSASLSAELVEIASTAHHVRRALLLEPEPAQSADRLVARLRSDTEAAIEARREAARRQSASRQPQ